MTLSKEVEVILARQLASYLAMPIFIVDPQGTLVFYNEPAEVILGCRFEETGAMPVSQWSTLFTPTDDEGKPLTLEQMPLTIALAERRPIHRTFWIRGLNGMPRWIGVTALPLVGQANRFLGALAFFWEARR